MSYSNNVTVFIYMITTSFNKYAEPVGKYVCFDGDTLMVTNCSPFMNTYTLQDGRKVSNRLIEDILIENFADKE